MGIEQSKKTLDKVISDIEKRQAINAKRESRRSIYQLFVHIYKLQIDA